jgi:arginase family enzyme
MTDFGGAVKQSEEYNIAIIGIPFDEKSCYLRGASKGPQAIRAASTGKAMWMFQEIFSMCFPVSKKLSLRY